jgi:broad specificity phosphatase PhoE
MQAFGRIEASGAEGVLVVGHKGVIRTIAEKLLAAALPEGAPELACAVALAHGVAGPWRLRERGGGAFTN